MKDTIISNRNDDARSWHRGYHMLTHTVGTINKDIHSWSRIWCSMEVRRVAHCDFASLLTDTNGTSSCDVPLWDVQYLIPGPKVKRLFQHDSAQLRKSELYILTSTDRSAMMRPLIITVALDKQVALIIYQAKKSLVLSTGRLYGENRHHQVR